MRTAGEAHERAEKMKSAKEARDRADRRAKKGKEEWDRRNWYEYRPPSKKAGDEEDDEGSREAHEHRERTRRHREACDRAYTQAKDTEERGWLTELQARFKNLLRLRKKIEAMKANIENMEHEDTDILESERRFRNRTSYRTSIWDQIIENEEMEQARRHAERLQARTSETIKLSWAEKELKQCENEHRRLLSLQSQQRREQAGRVAATLTATSEHITQQEAEQKRARENEMSGRLAREKEERCRDGEARPRQVEREHKERESVRKETRKADLGETQKDEAVRRQRVLEKIDKQKQETLRKESCSPYFRGPKLSEVGPKASHVYTSESVFTANTERTRSRRVPQSRTYQPWSRAGSPTPAYNPSTSSWRDREQPYASDSEEGRCYHGTFWPRMKGEERCSNCARFCNAFFFRCLGCGILACVSCRDQLRQGGSWGLLSRSH